MHLLQHCKNVLTLSMLALATIGVQSAEGPPSSNGVITNPTLVANQSVAKAQAVGAISTFMGQGSKQCDENGKNCRSLFGADDSLDYTSVQLSSQQLTGVQSFSFMSGDGDDRGNSNTVSSQTGTVALACGDTSPKTVAGIAMKVSSCAVNPQGDAQMTFQVCTGPTRGNPVKPPEKTMVCSTDPAAPNYRPKPGYSCVRPTCDTEPQGSLNGWSAPMTVSWEANVAKSGTDDQKAKNGLGMVFYPSLAGGITPSYSADSDNMSAVKIVETFINNTTNQTAVGMRVAYRFKSTVTKDMMIAGPSAVPHPEKNTAQWDTILKLNSNAAIPQYQQKFAANGSECLQQIGDGIGKDGIISVCDKNFTNESGLKPIQKTAQVVAEGQDCGTTPQCLKEVVNTNTYTQSCNADVPLALRKCTIKQDYTMEKLSWTRTRTAEECTEARATVVNSCKTKVSVGATMASWAPAADLSASGSTSAQTVLKFQRAFTTPVNAGVVEAQITSLFIDNWAEIRLNGKRIFASINGNLNNVKDGDTYTNCDNDTWLEKWTDGDGNPYESLTQGVRCTMPDGSRQVADYNDDCSDSTYCGRTAKPVNINIPLDYVKPNGQINYIDMACYNNMGRSVCNYAIALKYLTVSKYEVDNSECKLYEDAK